MKSPKKAKTSHHKCFRTGKGQSAIKSGKISKKGRARTATKSSLCHIGKILEGYLDISLHDSFDHLKRGPTSNLVDLKGKSNTTTSVSPNSKSECKGDMNIIMTRSRSKMLTKSADDSSAMRHQIFDATTPSCDRLNSLVIEILKKNKSESYSFIVPHKKKERSIETPLNLSYEPLGNTTINSSSDQPMYYSTPISILGHKSLPNKQEESLELKDFQDLSQCTTPKKFSTENKVLRNRFTNYHYSMQRKSDSLFTNTRSKDKSEPSTGTVPKLKCEDSISQQHVSETSVSKYNNFPSKQLLSEHAELHISIKTPTKMEHPGFQQNTSANVQSKTFFKTPTGIKRDDSIYQHTSEHVQSETSITTTSNVECENSACKQLSSVHIHLEIPIKETFEIECAVSQQYTSGTVQFKTSLRIPSELECGGFVYQQATEQVQSETSITTTSDFKCDNSVSKQLLPEHAQSDTSIKNISERECAASQQQTSGDVQSETSFKTLAERECGDSVPPLASEYIKSDTCSIEATSDLECDNYASKQYSSVQSQSDISIKNSSKTPIKTPPRCESSQSVPRHASEYVQYIQSDNSASKQHFSVEIQSDISIKNSSEVGRAGSQQHISEGDQSETSFGSIPELECYDYVSHHASGYVQSDTTTKTSYDLDYDSAASKQLLSEQDRPQITNQNTSEMDCAGTQQLISEGDHSETSFGSIPELECYDSVYQHASGTSITTTFDLEYANYTSKQSLSHISNQNSSEMEYAGSQQHTSENDQPKTSFTNPPEWECGVAVSQHASEYVQPETSIKTTADLEFDDSAPIQHLPVHAQSENSLKNTSEEDVEPQQNISEHVRPELECDVSILKDHRSRCSHSKTSIVITPEVERGDSVPQQHVSEYPQSDNSIRTRMSCAQSGISVRTTAEVVQLDPSRHVHVRESEVIDLTENVEEEDKDTVFNLPRRISKPGKSWRRELYKYSLGNEETRFQRRSFIKVVPLNPNRRITITEGEELGTISERLGNISLNTPWDVTPEDPLLARKNVLLKCGQQEPESFEAVYNKRTLCNCKKIGEGTYGEVFRFEMPSAEYRVMKIMPIEGDEIVSGEKQKKFCEILSEITIAMALSNLRENHLNFTDTFNQIYRVRCVKGAYPKILLKQWEKFDHRVCSDNDHPRMFKDDQLYVVLELRNGGTSLENYKFKNPTQSYYMFQQIAFALAVAENVLKFEHRDLHWGNVLVVEDESNEPVKFRLNGVDCYVPTKGVRATIIDFTLSRMEFENNIIFCDLAQDDELFKGDADVDYQFEIYRLMKEKIGNNWQEFQPYSNLLWLHYLLDKAIHRLKYVRKAGTVHKGYINKLNALKDEVLSYGSVTNFVMSKFVSRDLETKFISVSK